MRRRAVSTILHWAGVGTGVGSQCWLTVWQKYARGTSNLPKPPKQFSPPSKPKPAFLVRLRPLTTTWHLKIFATNREMELQLSTSTIVAGTGCFTTSPCPCRSCAYGLNASNWCNGSSKDTVTFVRSPAIRSRYAFCCVSDCSTSIATGFTVSERPQYPSKQISSALSATG